MGHQLPFYKYLNSGANIPQQVGVIGDRLDLVNRSIESQTERVFGSEGVQATVTHSASSTPPPVQLPSLSLPLVKVTLPTPNTTGEFSFGEVRLQGHQYHLGGAIVSQLLTTVTCPVDV